MTERLGPAPDGRGDLRPLSTPLILAVNCLIWPNASSKHACRRTSETRAHVTAYDP